MFGNLIGSILGYNASLRNVNMQQQMNERNLQQQWEMTKAQWERDDNAYERAINDLRNSGMSPLAVVGNPAMNSQAIYSPGVAPQYDASTVAGSLAAMDKDVIEMIKTGENKRHHIVSEDVSYKKLQFDYDKLESDEFKSIYSTNSQLESTTMTIQAQNERLQKQLESQERIEGNREYNKWQEDLENNSIDTWKQMCQDMGVTLPKRVYTDEGEFLKAWTKFNEDYRMSLSEYSRAEEYKNDRWSSNVNNSVNSGGSAGPINASAGISEGEGASADNKRWNSANWIDKYSTNKLEVPVYKGSRRYGE